MSRHHVTDRVMRVAFVGGGQMARNHFHALARIGIPTVVVGVHDRMAGQAERFARLARTQTFASVHRLLDEGRPDVVHVCTPPAAHVEGASAALDGGAHVYVEKPFAPTESNARALLELAQARGRLVCAGHQLLRDPAFETLLRAGRRLGAIVQVDSHFAFRPAGAGAARLCPRAVMDQLLDILPHPLYTLVAALERFGPPDAAVELEWARSENASLHATLRAGDVAGRLSVSLRARPVASSITLVGTRGSLACDFVRSIVVGAANPGTAALEKVLNPVVEGTQLVSRTLTSVARRLWTGATYPGLAEMIDGFYSAIASGSPSPVSPEHLVRVTGLFAALAERVHGAAPAISVGAAPAPPRRETGPLVVVTGARGFLGGHVARTLRRVRGIGRSTNVDDPNVHEWITADLGEGVSAAALDGADVVVHAAAETAGDFAAHQRNTIDATRHLLHAMHEAGVRRLVLISSLSVLRPPRTPWERQDEHTPRPEAPERFGPYVWGKSRQEELVEREAPALGIAVRIIRPGALVDWGEPELPGAMGRHLFGRWHLALGRSRLPIAVCDVARCAEAIAWCATHFDAAPPLVNLFEPALTTRGAFLARLRRHGWNGRIVWVPISTISCAIVAARTFHALLRGRLPTRLAAWSILRPRRYDSRMAAKVLAACR
jgi:predicted dehydrogenase/nucleoside-diphosphate-sugar epimerase